MKSTRQKLSPSVSSSLSARRKLEESIALLLQYRRLARRGYDFTRLFAEITEYEELMARHGDTPLAEADILEIGFGARPYRLLVMQSMGLDIAGVDAEPPVLDASVRRFREIVRSAGLERAAKSATRHLLFDRRERRALYEAMRRRGIEPRQSVDRLIVMDAGDLELGSESLDLIVSEDVFEHMDPATLRRLVPRMAQWLRPSGLALIRPNIFPGIVGGHLIEWSRADYSLRVHRRSQPWEHLRARRYKANTALNEFTRADYRELFSGHFEILEERVAQPDLGREFFDADVRAELAEWPEEELFSNQTLFVLRRPAST
jgi:hypothetical protein